MLSLRGLIPRHAVLSLEARSHQVLGVESLIYGISQKGKCGDPTFSRKEGTKAVGRLKLSLLGELS